MPRPEINDYIIYKIACNDENITDCYVGSTANFNKRKYAHKANCNSNNPMSHYKVYEMIRKNGNWDNWTMFPIAEYKQLSLIQSKIKEEEYRVKLNAQLNSRAAYRSDEQLKEYERLRTQSQERKEYMKEYNKKYQLKKQEKLNAEL